MNATTQRRARDCAEGAAHYCRIAMHSFRTRSLTALALTIPLALSASCSDTREASLPLTSREHKLCGWLHEQPDAADTELGYDTFAEHASELDAVHPKWWRVASSTTFVNHPRDREAPFRGFHDRRVLDHTTPGGAPTRLIPLVAATTKEDIAFIHVMIHDPELRKAHVAALSRLVVEHGYDGIDLDYEHLRAVRESVLPAKTMAEERAAFSAFVEATARALHARGKELSLAIPVTFSEDSEFDLDVLSAAADELHVMGYDFHYQGGDHAGPTAPLGWIQGFIAQVATIDGGRRSSRFILGLSNYGILGAPGSGKVEACEPLTRCFALFVGDYATTTDEMARCSEACCIDPGRAPNVLLRDGKRLFFEDLASLEEKVSAAQAGGFGGITYWGIGGEPIAPGSRPFFQMVRSHFPRGE